MKMIKAYQIWDIYATRHGKLHLCYGKDRAACALHKALKIGHPFEVPLDDPRVCKRCKKLMERDNK